MKQFKLIKIGKPFVVIACVLSMMIGSGSLSVKGVEELPPELVDKVLEFADPEGLPNYRLVSRSWNELATARVVKRLRGVFQKRIDEFVEDLETTEELGAALLRNQNRLLRLLSFHPVEVGENISKFPIGQRSEFVRSLLSTIRSYYNVLLTKVSDEKRTELGNTINQVIVDYPEPDMNAEVMRAAWVLFALDLPERVERIVNDVVINSPQVRNYIEPCQSDMQNNPKDVGKLFKFLTGCCKFDEQTAIWYLLHNSISGSLFKEVDEILTRIRTHMPMDYTQRGLGVRLMDVGHGILPIYRIAYLRELYLYFFTGGEQYGGNTYYLEQVQKYEQARNEELKSEGEADTRACP